MADVHLDLGYLRVDSALMQALFARPLSATQFKIVLELLMRLQHQPRIADRRRSYHGQRPPRTVRVSLGELAVAVHARSSRSFRAAVKQLVRWGIIVVAEPARGRRPPMYRIQRDLSRWALPAPFQPRCGGVGQHRASS